MQLSGMGDWIDTDEGTYYLDDDGFAIAFEPYPVTEAPVSPGFGVDPASLIKALFSGSAEVIRAQNSKPAAGPVRPVSTYRTTIGNPLQIGSFFSSPLGMGVAAIGIGALVYGLTSSPKKR